MISGGLGSNKAILKECFFPNCCCSFCLCKAVASAVLLQYPAKLEKRDGWARQCCELSLSLNWSVQEILCCWLFPGRFVVCLIQFCSAVKFFFFLKEKKSFFPLNFSTTLRCRVYCLVPVCCIYWPDGGTLGNLSSSVGLWRQTELVLLKSLLFGGQRRKVWASQ